VAGGRGAASGRAGWSRSGNPIRRLDVFEQSNAMAKNLEKI
jgi:hypothetical protein